MPTMTAQDKKWQAEQDARTLAEAEVVKRTPIRMRAATKAAKGMAEEERKKAVGMRKVAGMKPLKKGR